MKITRHCCERYCERILNIPKNEIGHYLSLDYAEHAKQIEQLVEGATLVYQGQVGKKRPSAYYINKDIMIVCSFESKEAITVYPIDFPYPFRVRKALIKSLSSEISIKNRQFQRLQVRAQKKSDVLRGSMDRIDKQLAVLRARINTLEEKKKSHRRKLWEVKNGSEELQKELECLVTQLVGQNPEINTKAAGVK
ncbi:MAG: hypothetical protein ABFD08_15430 [Syntrophomonas sp.]